MKKIVLFIGFALMFSAIFFKSAVAQNLNLVKKDPSNAKNLLELEQIFKDNFEIDRSVALSKLRELNQAPRIEQPDGSIWEIESISPLGMPMFNRTDNNLDAAKTISTNKVWPGGTVGTSLSGSGMTSRLGVWDGGGVLTTHQEFGGRVVQVDNPSTIEFHATHVAGTMVAAGVNANAKGMAYQAPLKAYDWNSDNSEMTSAAAAGLLVSNHSYSTITGWEYNNSRWEWWGTWSLSQTEDYIFGFYVQKAAEWDQIALSNPYYLIVKSAGNDRGEAASGSTWWRRDGSGNWIQATETKPGAVGPYDCMPAYSCAKNILTIGAVNAIPGGYTTPSGVVMSSFSGWGPTDDGRIKPDVVGDGVNVTSCTNTSNTSYVSSSGTSMSGPNVAGSTLLIQQHNFNLKGSYLKSSTLKGLIIHTADEAGTAAGPDYRFGWGLMNTAKAVQTLSDSATNMVLEASLSNKATYTYNFVTDGTKPVRATICWTDRPGTPPPASLDPTTKMLVNDLDIRIIRNSDNQVFYPYKMDPANPANAATTGDNDLDNVEQIHIATPTAGSYTITVNHKGNLYGSIAQPFGLIISGMIPKPLAGFTVANRSVCTNSTVALIDQSANVTTRMWYFPGGNPSTSTAKNPTVSYSVPGTYPVALRVSNLSGLDSLFVKEFISVGGISLPLFETFEDNSGTKSLWTIQNPNADTTWRIWNIQGNTPGNKAMGMNNYVWLKNGNIDGLLSPVLDLRGMQSASLSFQHAYTRYDASTSDSLIVSISTNCGSSYTRLMYVSENGTGNFATAPDSTYRSVDAFVPSKATDWCGGGTGANCYNLNLTPYVGNYNVRIKLEQKAKNGGNNMFIDNINVSGVPLSPIANFYALNKTICPKQYIQFMDSSRNNPSSWQWYFEGAVQTTSTEKYPIVQYANAGTFKVSLKVTNQTGLDSIEKVDFITILASPDKPIVTANNSTILCNGDSVLFTSSITSNIQWFRDSMLLSGAITSELLVKTSGAYFVRAYNANSCYTQSDIFDVQTGIYPAVPTVTKSLSGNVFCDGGSFTLTSSAVSGNQWMRNGVDIDGQTGQVLIFSDSGTFVAKVGNNGCNSFSAPLRLDKMPSPKTSEISGKNYAVKTDTVNYSVSGDIMSTFTWSVSGGSIVSGNNTSQIAVKWGSGTLGTVQVQEIGSNACRGAVKTLGVNLVNTGILESDLIKQFKMFPNPASQNLTLQFELLRKSVASVRILDLFGKELISQKLGELDGIVVKQIDISGISQGVYVLELLSDDKLVRCTLVKN